MDSWQKSSHHAVAVCNDCHFPTTLSGSGLQKLTTAFFTHSPSPRATIKIQFKLKIATGV